MVLHVDTSDFVGAHGRLPKGFGAWTFNLGRSDQGTWVEHTWCNSYKTARRFALRMARECGCDRVLLAS